MRSDTNFNGMAEPFEREIYGSSKGYVRLNVLWEDMVCEIPRLRRGTLRILDAGGGAGHMAVRLAKLGNKVVLCDPSQEMLSMAANRARQESVEGLVTIVQSSIHDLRSAVTGRFDVITCHAVLEWLADPGAALGHLVKLLTRDGHLSLMFYNRNAALLKRIIRGDFATQHDYGEGPTPGGPDSPVPLDEQTVREWLERLGLRVVSKAGIRIFRDLLAVDVNQERLPDLLRVEKELRKQEPFASIGQHVHLVCVRAKK